MITIPIFFWRAMLSRFAAAPKRVEQVGYFDGYELGDHGVVTTTTIPEARLERRFFEVSPEAMSAAGRHLRQLGQVRLAQIHTHPGTWVEHSEHDDERAYSQRAGALSIVVPNYGRGGVVLEDCGLHVREEGEWRMLSLEEYDSYLRIIPDRFVFGGRV